MVFKVRKDIISGKKEYCTDCFLIFCILGALAFGALMLERLPLPGLTNP